MFTQKEYILIDMANHLGFDKLSYELRIKKASTIAHAINIGTRTLEEAMEYAESPYEFRNAYNAWLVDDYNHVVGLDAVNQALQLYGVLTGDLATASLASLGVNERTDAYQMLADALNRSLNTEVFTRKNCKKSLMVTLYGSQNGATEILNAMKMHDSMELANKLGLQGVDDEWLDKEFNLAMATIAPKAMEAMECMQELNDENIGIYNWVMPDGFRVKYDVKSNQSVELKAKSRGGINFSYSGSHKVYAPSKFNRGMSPNIIHSVDGYVARQMVRRMGDKFISTIHDQFNCRACDAHIMQQNYNDIMVELLNSDLLNDIIKQINPNARTINKSNTLTEELIQSSSYSIS